MVLGIDNAPPTFVGKSVIVMEVLLAAQIFFCKSG